MEQNNQHQNNIKTDTINLVELLNILISRKMLIIIITTVITIFSFIYVNYVVAPVYKGNTIVEVGKVINKNDKGEVHILSLENFQELKGLISAKYSVSVSSLGGNGVIDLSYTSTDKKQIKKTLEESLNFILQRDKKIAKLYSGNNAEVIMTQVVSPVKVSSAPIKPKKKLVVVVSFITGFIFSIFLVFFLEFLAEAKRKRA